VALSTDETDFMLQIFKGAIPSGGRIPGDVAGIIPTAISSAPDPLQALIAEVAADVGITSATVIDQIWLKLVSETVGQLESLRGLELPDLWDAVETHLFDLSGSPLERVSRKGSSVGYNAGRDLFAKLMVIEDRASHGIRVEILDTASCGVCPGLDGQIMQIGSSEWEEYLPPSKCLGAGRCRGFVTVIAKELTDALN